MTVPAVFLVWCEKMESFMEETALEYRFRMLRSTPVELLSLPGISFSELRIDAV